ncbi:aldehyde dehydrogenase [Labrenzia sp. PHM005]|uniref:aldehyde dehydrogenase n=1 Tax=Labrenzia sp. PHM005 TaxID=2590016 RepID=UPI0011405FEB|nr:aldehyde dehydrogenase [Labrenzia sp. PHM005]QDG78529.1 aldehyde dehydrogenase [Labrenzia sp. PHM005]
MNTTQLLINGRKTDASDGQVFECKNPVTGDVATIAPAATQEDAVRAVDAAAQAFPGWAKTTPRERRNYLLAAANALQARSEDLVAAMKDEIGATEAWARFNIGLAAEMFVEAASVTTQIKGEIIPTNRPGSTSMAIRQPAGVVLAMAPWNAPVILGVRALALPLACGNTVVLKSSELCPQTHGLIVEALIDAHFPGGVVNAISNRPGDAPNVVETLIAQPAVRRINFTGSTRVGRIIAETAGRYLKPALLELGGKAPLIVLEDADLDAAAAAAGFGAFMNQGQICMSTERIIVLDCVAEAFVEKFAAKVASLTAGDPRDAQYPLGSMISEEAATRVGSLVEDAVKKGAKIIAGGGGRGSLMNAVALDHVGPSMRLYSEESFGPVASIIRVASVDEAVSIANESEFGLSSAVFGRDHNRAMAVAQRIESGICHINGPTVHDEAQVPFGGVKSSGYGRFGSAAGIDEFTEVRWITVQDGPLHYPI